MYNGTFGTVWKRKVCMKRWFNSENLCEYCRPTFRLWFSMANCVSNSNLHTTVDKLVSLQGKVYNILLFQSFGFIEPCYYRSRFLQGPTLKDLPLIGTPFYRFHIYRTWFYRVPFLQDPVIIGSQIYRVRNIVIEICH